MGIFSDLLSNSKSQLKYLYSLSNPRFIRRISSPAVDDPAPTSVGDLKSNNKLTMLLIEHFHNGSGNCNPEYSSRRSIRFPPYNYSLISCENSWTDHHSLCNNPFSGYGGYFVGSSCNELVLVFFKMDGDRIALWNPTINKIKILPQSDVPARRPGPASTNTIVHGFGFDPESEDYKVLRFIVFGYKDGSNSIYDAPHVELYSLKTNSWKKITYPTVSVPYQKHSVHVNGVYYWVDFIVTPAFMLSFDFANEEFSDIPLPSEFGDHDKEGLFGKLFVPVEFDGSLAALVHSELGNTGEPFSVEVWGWNGESWLERMPITTIDVPGGVSRVLGLFQDDKLFLHGFKKGELMLFDLAKCKLENLGIHADTDDVEIFPYVSVLHK